VKADNLLTGKNSSGFSGSRLILININRCNLSLNLGGYYYCPFIVFAHVAGHKQGGVAQRNYTGA
jgi:hypothetical protein